MSPRRKRITPEEWQQFRKDWRKGDWSKDRGRRMRGPRPPRVGFLFFGFIGSMLFMLLIFTAGIWLLNTLYGAVTGTSTTLSFVEWFGLCGLGVMLPMLAVWVSVRIFRGITRPLEEVMQGAEAVAAGDLSTRVPERGQREVRRLSKSFNKMVEELQQADEQRRNLTADVAHELRTPLHVIQGNLEGILDGVYEADETTVRGLLDETQTLSRLVEDLGTLSLAEAGELHLSLETVKVNELLQDLATSFSGQAESAGVELKVEIEEDASIEVDAGRLDQVLSNLMINALRHTAEGGSITLQAAKENGAVMLEVVDTGEGIPEEELPYIFNRFWRGDKSRGGEGHGLGLAIARQLVLAHGGAIEVESELGVGTRFRVVL
ncbi:MAG: HAMP domain-containing protein [Chloroflexi bacterium]|nr:MAG: HAMP domain-containing protein [Chloroflexota bacterium]MBL1196363.1 HAMP domain-containing protein [Chloroflexota bacterium]NOH13658.1 HAMP domain-containing protein [Chloroflexota bacterium]